MNAEQRSRALALLEDGASYREAARTVAVSRSTVMKALPGFGWTYRQAGEFRAATRDYSRERGRR